MRIVALPASVFLFVSLGWSQATGAANTQAACSPANTGSNNTFTINCGIGKQQGDRMIEILNRILADQLDPAAVMAKLDEMQKGIEDIRKNTARIEARTDAASSRRSLTQSQQQTIYSTINGLCSVTTGRSVMAALVWEPFDESSDYAGYFEVPLGAANCLGYRSELRSLPPISKGVVLITSDWDHPSQLALALRNAFMAASINFALSSEPFRMGEVGILIGIKP